MAPLKIFSLLIFISALSGCASSYVPRLAAPPSDPDQFNRDLAACRIEANGKWDRASAAHPEGDIAAAACGAFCAIAVMPKADAGNDYFKNVPQMTDECMALRGYKLLKDR